MSWAVGKKKGAMVRMLDAAMMSGWGEATSDLAANRHAWVATAKQHGY